MAIRNDRRCHPEMICDPCCGFDFGAEFAEVMVCAVGPDDPDGPPAVLFDCRQLGPAGIADRLARIRVTMRAD